MDWDRKIEKFGMLIGTTMRNIKHKNQMNVVSYSIEKYANMK